MSALQEHLTDDPMFDDLSFGRDGLVGLVCDEGDRLRLEAAVGRLLLAHNQLEQTLIWIIASIAQNDKKLRSMIPTAGGRFGEKIVALRSIVFQQIMPENDYDGLAGRFLLDIENVSKVRNRVAHGWAPEEPEPGHPGADLLSRSFKGVTSSLRVEEIEAAAARTIQLCYELPNFLVYQDVL